MALIGTIRNNSWLLIALLGVALAAFIIMDVTSSQNMGGGDQFEMGSVNGEIIDYREFQSAEQILYSNNESDMYSRRDFLWNYFVEKKIVEEEADALGLSVSKAELKDLQFGNNLSPVIRQRFANPQTGRVDRNQLNNIKQQIESGQLSERVRPFWAYQEKEIIKTRLQTKLMNIVRQGMYVPSWYVELKNKRSGKMLDMSYVKIPFAEVSDAEVDISDEEINAYMSDHKEQYRNKEQQRIAKYLQLDVTATSEDSMEIRQIITEKRTSFAEAENDSLYAINNSGSFIARYSTKSELPDGIPTKVLDMAIDSVYGPYINGQYYQLVKVVDKMVVPDSVKARHILRQASPQQPQSLTQAENLIDSLKTVLESGQASFDSLALQYGQDGTRTKGGDLGTFGRNQMFEEFSNAVFYHAEEGDIIKIRSRAGVHLVEIQEQIFETKDKGVQLAIIQAPIVPSEATQNKVYDKALNLVTEFRTLEALKNAINDNPELELQETEPLKRNAYQFQGINNNSVSRSIIQWMYEGGISEGDVSADVYIIEHPVLYYNKSFVIAGLAEIVQEGMPPVDVAAEKIRPILLKKKKGMVLKNKITSQNLSSIASNFGTDVDTVKQVKLSSTSISGLGNEAELVSAAFNLPKGDVSQPIIGENGVYVIKILSKSNSAISTSIPTMRSRIKREMTSTFSPNFMKSLKEKAEIEDYRSNFF